MNAFARLGRSTLLVLGTGYILHFFSETVFWSVWRPGDELSGRLFGLLLYCLFAYLTLVVIRLFRIADIWGLMLAGAFFGWTCEGVYAMTVYGDSSMPFPLTIAWTALAWHGPLSVVLGWYMLGVALRERSPGPSLLLSLGLGAFWGLWALGWRGETPPVSVEPDEFLLHATAATICLASAHVLVAIGRPETFAPSRWGIALAALPVLAFFGAVTVPTVPISALVLPVLLGALYVALRRLRASSPDSSLLIAFRPPLRIWNFIALAAMPLAATAVYMRASPSVPDYPTVHPAVAAVISVGGTLLFAIGYRRAFRRRA
ncbi:hypothetical protein KPL78_01450 [Roseomonas sp. HJA6]|uniref:DUF998 domain-containing protein n=1 Tax=Roseomonas alba TaxID=2846776 RepID=A0ABS7A2F7_9PROT|nr:hypothetical protein [Neoroseomonas alba]MBW6396487.1 hypothetical protein [Neoroseomonas alba]